MAIIGLILSGLASQIIGGILIIVVTDKVLQEILNFMNRSGNLQTPGDVDRLRIKSRKSVAIGIGCVFLGFILEIIGNSF